MDNLYRNLLVAGEEESLICIRICLLREKISSTIIISNEEQFCSPAVA